MYFLRLCCIADSFLTLRTVGVFLPFLTCTSFPHYYVDFEKVCILFDLNNKAVLKRVLSPDL